MGTKPDLVAIVEASYDLHRDHASWLRAVAAAAAPHFDRGKGVYAFVFDATDPSRFTVESLVPLDDATVLPQLVVEWHRLLSPELIERMYWGSTPLAPISQRLGVGEKIADHPAMRRFCHQLGIVDQLTVRATDSSFRGVALCTPLGSYMTPTPAESGLWTRIAAHVSAGLRLRRSLGDGRSDSSALADGEDAAILTPDGRCEHANGAAQSRSAREALRSAVRRVDRVRTSSIRQDPQKAIELWRGLVDGRWSLVDSFDSDGRRFVVARSNAPEATDPRALTAQEQRVVAFVALGHTNKEIAYALGLSVSTVASHLTTVRRKLGIRSRAELIRAYHRMREQPEGGLRNE